MAASMRVSALTLTAPTCLVSSSSRSGMIPRAMSAQVAVRGISGSFSHCCVQPGPALSPCPRPTTRPRRGHDSTVLDLVGFEARRATTRVRGHLITLSCAVWGVSGWFPGEGTPQSAWHAPEDLSRASERIRRISRQMCRNRLLPVVVWAGSLVMALSGGAWAQIHSKPPFPYRLPLRRIGPKQDAVHLEGAVPVTAGVVYHQV